MCVSVRAWVFVFACVCVCVCVCVREGECLCMRLPGCGFGSEFSGNVYLYSVTV